MSESDADQIERLRSLREELVEKEERVAELEQRRDELRQERDQIKQQYAEAIAPTSILDVDELVARFDLSTLREKAAGADRSPSTSLETVEPAIQSGASHTERATLAGDDAEKAAELKARLADLPDRDTPLIRHTRAEIEEELDALRGGST